MALNRIVNRMYLIVVVPMLAAQGCTTLAVGAGGTFGVAAVQERTIGDAVDDTVIHATINHKIFQADIDLFQDVGVEVVEGRVLLTGTVPTPEDRIEAVRLAWQADGIKEIINELQVTDDSGVVDYAKDIWISAQLKTRLLFDEQIHAINYNVETVNGSIYMIGIAWDRAELERATNHARTIKGVRKVISHVRLKNAPRVNSPASATQ